jgi:hypothetical protein
MQQAILASMFKGLWSYKSRIHAGDICYSPRMYIMGPSGKDGSIISG